MNWGEVGARLVPTHAVTLTAPIVLTALVAALVVVGVGPVWRAVRLVVTLVHELGHAVVGIAVGRRFTGFVLRGDMSGHAVTVGPTRGAGRLVTTWAGYPAPAVVGAAMVYAAGRGWSAPMVTAGLVVLVVALLRVRSALTALVMLLVLGANAALWWWRNDRLQATVLVGLGVVLVVGAWRHLAAVAGSRDRGSDSAVLAALTRVPRALWTASFALVCAGATAVAARVLLDLVR
ncbi:Peptidase M50B-like [Pedococcus cremeus]|uniref:Peptidase M50B-like n=1 Tax=Pedococcus cremeus TaxID=587636 RepID=A0A1H9X960_9MICO|nr:M50 family metallopeptidase [Pedococcus cremeus]SES42609.1 Peptidase M50B-like [Pedococcus cremeus]